MGNSHRTGLLRPDGTYKAIASGSEKFCKAAAARYRKSHPGTETIVIAHKPEGLPPTWNKE